jgi:hypothetical protein
MCMYVCVYMCLYICVCICVYVCVYLCVYVCVCICVHICVYVCVYMCVCMYVYICVCCRRFTACKRTLRAWIEMFRKQNSTPISHPDCLPDGSGGHIRIDRRAARPVVQSPTATNAHEPVTSARGGLSPYRAVEPWLLLLYKLSLYPSNSATMKSDRLSVLNLL